jgi:hypothetical protein
MKNFMTFILLAIVVLGCNTAMKNENAELKAELAALAEENAQLAAGNIDMVYEVEGYQSMLQEIDQNLAAMDVKKKKVKELAASGDKDLESEILLHLEHLHGTLANTKHKVAHLQKNLNELYKDETADKEVIASLEDQLDGATLAVIAQDEIIDDLNATVVSQGYVIDDLTAAYVEQAAVSDVLYDIINTAYVVVGTKKELEDYGIIVKEGGIIGLGSLKSLAATADDEWFVPVAIDATDDIELFVKKANVLTIHPESSFELIGDKTVESLVILDKGAFWDKSDFLVVEVVDEK